MKTLLVDDEPIARRVLREGLEAISEIEIVGEADNGAAALEKITEHRPDLVFLDLQMPTIGGLDVVRNLKSGKNMPVIIFVTAYDRYALQAFEAGAIDYLLKPIRHERLIEALERAKRVTGIEAVERVAHLQEISDPVAGPRVKRIVGRLGEEYFVLSVDEVYAFQAEGNLVRIITAKQQYLAAYTLKVLQERFKNTSFHRIHRNAMVNVDHVRKMSELSSRRWLITLNNEQTFIASRRQAQSIRQLLQW